MVIKLQANEYGDFDIGTQNVPVNGSITLSYDSIYESEEEVITNKQWGKIINLINDDQIIVYTNGDVLSKADAINLLQGLVNDHREFAIKYLSENSGIQIDPNIDENGDNVITRSEILDADNSGDNNWSDLHAIATGNVVD